MTCAIIRDWLHLTGEQLASGPSDGGECTLVADSKVPRFPSQPLRAKFDLATIGTSLRWLGHPDGIALFVQPNKISAKRSNATVSRQHQAAAA